jgi:drug/metabolite transporter (DMT)-like permease
MFDQLRTRSSAAVVAAITVTVLLWGSAFVAIRAAVPSLGFQSLAATRLLLGAAVFGLLARRLGVTRPTLRQLPPLIGIAATGLFGYQLLLSAGETRTPAGISAMLFASGPVLVMLLARAFLGEQLARRRWCGVVVALIGAVVTSAAQGLDGGAGLGGPALVLAAICCYAPWVILSKRTSGSLPSNTIAAWSTWIAAVMMLPLSTGIPHAIGHADASALVSVLFLGIVVTTVPLVLWTWALSKIPASVASSSLLLIGPCAMLASGIVLGEVPSLSAALGGAVTLGGVAVAQLRRDLRRRNRVTQPSARGVSVGGRRRGSNRRRLSVDDLAHERGHAASASRVGLRRARAGGSLKPRAGISANELDEHQPPAARAPQLPGHSAMPTFVRSAGCGSLGSVDGPSRGSTC